jgi:hypothetical protein
MPLKGDPSVPRTQSRQGKPQTRDYLRLSGITVERARLDASPRTKHFTNFKTHYTDPISIPTDLMHPDRGHQDGRYHIDVGQLPEK